MAGEAGNGEIVKAPDAGRAAPAPAIRALGLRLPEKIRRGRRRKVEAA